MKGMMGMRGIRVGMRGIRVGMMGNQGGNAGNRGITGNKLKWKKQNERFIKLNSLF